MGREYLANEGVEIYQFRFSTAIIGWATCDRRFYIIGRARYVFSMICRHITALSFANNDLILQPLTHLSLHARLSYVMQSRAVHQIPMMIPIAFLEGVVITRRFATIH